MLQHELAPVPTSMFDDKGGMRIAAGKSALKNKLQLEMSRFVPEPDITIIHGCAILWIFHWPGNGTVKDFLNNVSSYIFVKAIKSDVYIVLHRFFDFSIKSVTRSICGGEHGSRRHKLILQTPMPPQTIILIVTENKV